MVIATLCVIANVVHDICGTSTYNCREGHNPDQMCLSIKSSFNFTTSFGKYCAFMELLRGQKKYGNVGVYTGEK